jgi:hypothetical protein
MASWYVRNETGEQLGPIDDPTVLREIQAGRISRNAWVAAAGAAQWVPLETAPEFAAAFSGAAPPTAMTTVDDPPVATNVSAMSKPTAGIVVKKIIAAIVAIVVIGGIGVVLYLWLEILWLTLVVAGVGLLGGVLMIVGAFKGLIARCPYCNGLVGASATGVDLEVSAEPTIVRCEGCGEYLTAQQGQLRATDPSTLSDDHAFECACYKDSTWPPMCAVCGAPPERFDDLHAGSMSGAALLVGRLTTYSGSIKGVPHCAQHKEGVALKIEDEKLRLRFRSLRMMRRYVALNRGRA